MKSPPVRPKERFLVFGAPDLQQTEIDEAMACMHSGWIGTGPRVAQFENDFGKYKDSPFAVAVNSGTAALHLSMLAAGLQPGDEVITTAMTFCATVNAIVHAGLIPVLADIDPQTLNIDPADVEARITPRTKAILPVHFAGRSCDMDALLAIAKRHNLRIVEDCAHAIETEFKGLKAGTAGDFGCFSFYTTKNVVTGEGGMVLTRNEDAANKIKTLALHGMSNDAWKRFSDSGYKHYEVTSCGFKYNMMDLQASLGIHQLRRVETNWMRRKEIWLRYHTMLNGLPVELPMDENQPDSRHAYHLYTIQIDETQAGIGRDDFLAGMTSQNIGVGVHYRSIPEHPFYRETFGWQPKDYPHAEKFGRQTVSLPLSSRLTDQDVDDVVEAVKRCLGKA